MRAAYIERYGPPERISLVETPIPEAGAGEVLVKVEAAAVTAGDARLRAGRFPRGFALPARLAIGIRGPRSRIPGAVLSGRVERVGDGVADLSRGDAVAGMTGMRLGAHAEYAVVPATRLALKPAAVSHADAAAALFGGTTALHFLRGRVGPGVTVLVNGASGSVGTSAVQLAARAGAVVTAVSSGANRELVASLGAQRVVDYRETPVTQLDERFDVVLDAVGNLSRSEGLRLTGPSGALALVAAGLGDTLRARGRVLAGAAPERREDFRELLELLETGELAPVREVVGGLDALPEAHRRIDGGHKAGNLVILPGAAEGTRS